MIETHLSSQGNNICKRSYEMRKPGNKVSGQIISTRK